MRIQTIVVINMGTIGAYVQYITHKFNTMSLTETKLVGVNDFLTQVIWTQYFLKEKGYEINDNVIYQYNQNTLKL